MELIASHLFFSFDDNIILNDVSFKAPEGKISVLVGANGSGKTTLLNILSGLIHQVSGDVYIGNVSTSGLQSFQISRHGVIRTFQQGSVICSLTVRENVLLSFPDQIGERLSYSFLPGSRIRQESELLSDKVEKYLHSCGLSDVSDSFAGQISLGQQKLLNIVCCIASGKPIWLLDEPVAGIDSSNRETISQLILREKQKGKTILIIEHNQEFIKNVADRVLFLHHGFINEYSSYDEYVNSVS